MKIQIMTISGKVVREIEMNELGPIRIGRNITEFTWDGTDQYGDRLANGLYFYRVVASNNSRQLEKLETSADKYFKSGLGKIYMIK
jgi:flagellar hook assembly protein FlgD